MTQRSTHRRGLSTTGLVIIVIVLGAVAAGFWWLTATPDRAAQNLNEDIFAARHGSFKIVIPTSGELAAIRQIEIRNEMEERATITEIVDEGTFVREGELLVQFNDEAIRTNIKDAEDELDNAINELENAEANLEIRKKTRESELAAADLAITLTRLALQSWEEGEVVESRQNLQLELKTAKMEHERLKDRFEASKRLYEQEFISLDEYKSDEIRLVEAETRLEQAKLAIDIYEKYTYVQEREQKESDQQQAIEERDRIQQRNDAEVRSAESDVRSAERQVESRREWLDKWERQLALCRIIAPSSGLVVYTSSLSTGGHGRRDEDPPMVGTDVPPKKTIMILPDTSEMTAEVKVNEALTGLIERGQRATVTSDAHPDAVLTGDVMSVGVLAETGGWRDPNRRDYTVKILLDEYDREALDLKPSMRCKADIHVGSVENAVYVPIQAVHRKGEAAYVWVPDRGGFSQKLVGIGKASELYVEITEGLEQGNLVLLREPEPKQIASTLDLPDAPTDSVELASFGRPEGEPSESTHGEEERAGDPASPWMNGGERPSREQLREMMENMTPEEREAMRQRMRDMRNRGGEDGSERPRNEESAGAEDAGS